MLWKELFSAVATVLTFVAFLPYIRSVLRGTVRAHVFSWVVWGTTTFVVFLAQLEAEAGVGAWPIGISGLIAASIAVLAFFKRGELSITRSDWAFFVGALSSLPLWYFTSDPLWAVVVLTTVDVLGFGPTIRKAHADPHSESLLFFSVFAIRNLFVIAALESYSLTTVLFPAAVSCACIGLVSMLVYRRHIVLARSV